MGLELIGHALILTGYMILTISLAVGRTDNGNEAMQTQTYRGQTHRQQAAVDYQGSDRLKH